MRAITLLASLPLVTALGCIGAPTDVTDAIDTSTEAISASSWNTVAGVSTRATPALASFNNALHMVAVGTTGTLRHTSTATSAGGWGATVDAGRPASTTLATDTAPVLLADGSTLYAFARGVDNNLYRTSRTSTTAWSAWTALTTHGRVRGRISVAFWRSGTVLTTHALFTALPNTVEYARYQNGVASSTNTFSGVTEGGLGTNGTNEVYVALRGTSSLTVYRWVTSILGTGWGSVGTRSTLGGLGRIYDVSDLAFFAGAFHVVYSYRTQLPPDYNTATRLAHARFIPGVADDNFGRTITSFTPSGDPDTVGITSVGRQFAEATLAVYRNKLVAGYRMPDGSVRYARWDNADPTSPWVGNVRVASGTSHRRPALAPYNGRSLVTDYGASNYGDDLFAASVDTSASTARALDFSRAIFKADVDAQFTLWTSNSDSFAEVCVNQNQVGAPTSVSISQEDRPYVSELGYSLWSLPSWFGSSLYREQAQYYCSTLPTWPASGRISTPCDTAKMPVIVRAPDAEFFCRGIWIARTGSYIRIWEELGHYAAQAMGVGDDSNAPTAENATRTGIAQTTLQSGYNVFSLGVGRCGSVTGRCVGFTGIANNYDATSREHSFVYTMYYYMRDGAQIRQWAADDAAAGNTQLQRKYNWVRDNIFRGVEFNVDLQPRAAL